MNLNLIIIIKKINLIGITLSLYFIWKYSVNACGQNPDPSAYRGSNHPYLKGAVQLNQEPIKPIFIERQLMRSNSISIESNLDNEKDDIFNTAANIVSKKNSEEKNNLEDIVQNSLQNINNKINNLTKETHSLIANSLHNISESTSKRLENSKLLFSEKFRPIFESAINIFNTPNMSEKDRWDKLVELVESTNLSDLNKRKFYQTILNDTLV